MDSGANVGSGTEPGAEEQVGTEVVNNVTVLLVNGAVNNARVPNGLVSVVVPANLVLLLLLLLPRRNILPLPPPILRLPIREVSMLLLKRSRIVAHPTAALILAHLCPPIMVPPSVMRHPVGSAHSQDARRRSSARQRCRMTSRRTSTRSRVRFLTTLWATYPTILSSQPLLGKK